MTADAPSDTDGGISVVVVCDFGHVNGGAAQVAIQSAIGLRHRGVDVTFLYAVDPIDERLRTAGVAVKRIPLDEVWTKGNRLSAAVQGIWNRGAAAQFSEFLSPFERRRTIVHFHQWTKCFSPSVLARSVALEFNTVITMHDYFMTCPNGALYIFPERRPCTLEPLSARCVLANCDSRSRSHKAVRLIRSGAQAVALSHLAGRPTIIHVSEFSRRIAEPQSIQGARHYTVPNPLLIERPERCAAEQHSEFLFVGRLTPEKGCLEFARAAHRRRMPVAFVGVGPMEDAIRDAYPAARLTGWVEPTGIAGIMQRSRALVFPSRWPETSGLVCLEALANGLPVIASDRTAAAAWIESGVNGILYDPDDTMAFDAALELLVSDPIVESMSRRAYERYWGAPASLERHATALVDVYRDVLSRVRSPSGAWG